MIISECYNYGKQIVLLFQSVDNVLLLKKKTQTKLLYFPHLYER